MRAEKRRTKAAAALAAAAFFVSDHAAGEPADARAVESLDVGGIEIVVHAPYRPLLEVAGIAGPAFRFDGNSTGAETDAAITLPLVEGLTVSAWVALASPPVETALILHLAGPEGALQLAVGPWRAPEFRVRDLRAASFEALALGRWVHLAGTFDGETARLYVDGALVARRTGQRVGLGGDADCTFGFAEPFAALCHAQAETRRRHAARQRPPAPAAGHVGTVARSAWSPASPPRGSG